MNDLFADERIQFFLRNRSDIKAWAAIETDVVAATRELLASALPSIEQGVMATDRDVLIGRGDGGQFERIMVRRPKWPATVALTLEWHRTVDPLGTYRPKVGVFWWADPPTLVEPRSRLTGLVAKESLQRLGYKVPLEGVWPVGAYVQSKSDWWLDPDAWLNRIVEQLTAAWPLVASPIEEALRFWVPTEPLP